jgi:UTP--glucose-1-phosphate uridylyltransferase
LALSKPKLVNIKKAVITAAGRNQNRLPLQVLVDSDGTQKSAVRIIFDEVMSAGIDQIGLVISPADQEAYETALEEVPARLQFITQDEPRGYGHALLCAQDFVQTDPFLHLVSDHLYLSGKEKTCAQQLVDVALMEACSVSAVQPTREGMLPYYGTVGGKRVQKQAHLYQVEKVLEKPTPTVAEQELIIPGLRAGHYLCFFGMHVLTAGVMNILQSDFATARNGSLPLSPALSELASREKYLACDLEGRRYNLGVKFGLFNAQLALALAGSDREDVLAQVVEVLATRASKS